MGGAILFVCTLAVTMIVGGAVFAYASHCFFTVVQETSAGSDEVIWPDGPFYDWLWEAAYMLWLSALWLGPIVLALQAVTDSHGGAAASAQVSIAAAALVWLFFPITLLSSMSASSRWVLVSPRLISRLIGQRFGSLGVFYMHSAPILAVAAAMTFFTFFTGEGGWLLPITATGSAAALVIYARQLGRLAHLIEHTAEPFALRSKPEPRRRPRLRVRSRDPWPDANRPLQPRELPPVMAPEGPITGYDVCYEDRPIADAPAPPRKRPIDLDDVPYELQGSPQVAPARGPMPKEWMEPSEYEMALARGGEAPPPPANPWTAGVYNFPLYQKTMPPFIALAAGFALLGLLIHMLISLKPG